MCERLSSTRDQSIHFLIFFLPPLCTVYCVCLPSQTKKNRIGTFPYFWILNFWMYWNNIFFLNFLYLCNFSSHIENHKQIIIMNFLKFSFFHLTKPTCSLISIIYRQICKNNITWKCKIFLNKLIQSYSHRNLFTRHDGIRLPSNFALLYLTTHMWYDDKSATIVPTFLHFFNFSIYDNSPATHEKSMNRNRIQQKKCTNSIYYLEIWYHWRSCSNYR